MSHPLQDRLRRLALRARRLTILHALSWFLVTAVAALLLVGAADFLLRSDEAPLRFLASLAIVAAFGWAYVRFLGPAITQRLSELQVASRVEARFPKLEGLVANTVAFLGETAEDPRAGSYAMRRAVVSQAMAEMEEIDLGECLDARAARRALGAAVVALAAVVGVFAALPSTASHAASRLLRPWERQPWPRRNALELVGAPNRLARGGDLEVEIVDRNGQMPDDVALEILRDDGQVHKRSAVFVGGKMLARVNNVAKSFQYRAVGGDDNTMPWRDLDVVSPPELLDVRVVVTPPSYSGWPEERFTGDARGLTGSKLYVQGLIDQPLQSASLKFQSGDAASGEPESLPLEITENAFWTNETLFEIGKSGQYWVDFVDHRGVRVGKPVKWNLEAVADNAPTVTFDAAEFNRYVTPAAIAPLRSVAEDDLALASAELVFTREGEESAEPTSISLWRGPAEAPKQESSQHAADRRDLTFDWQVGAIPGLKAGDNIEFRIAAEDYAGQRGESPAQRLTIVSRSELEDRLARDQGYIIERIGEALRAQRESRKQVKALEIQWDETKSFSKADIDQLQSAELNQRQVTRLLAGPQEGVLILLRRLARNIADNRLNNPDLSRRVKQLNDGVGNVVKKLPAIQRPLLSSLKDVRPLFVDADEKARIETPADSNEKIKLAGGGQDEVITMLEQLLGEMAQWENYRRFAREVGRLQREQDDLEQRTDDIRLETLSRDWESLTPQQRARLRRLAQEQVGLAQRLDKLQSRMQQASGQLKNEDPLAAETLAEGAAAAQQLAISGQMREIARRLGANQVGQAKQRQAEVKDALSELLSILGNRREDELDRKMRKFGELASTLADLESREQAVADQLDALSKSNNPDPRELQRLSKQQQQLAEQAEQISRRLERLEAQQPSSAASEAAQSMRASSQAGQQQNAQQAAEKAKSALEKLQQAREQLQQQMQQTQQELFFERLARLEQNIRGLQQRQTSIGETITEFLIVEETQPLSREQQATLKNVADHQSDVGAETAELGEQVSEAKVFFLALSAAGREMARSGRFLDNAQLAEADQASKIALTRLNQLIEALQPPPPSENPDPPMGQGGQQPNQQPPADAINQLAQLKLVKLLQEEILRRTRQLEEIGSTQSLTPEQVSEYEDLSREQGRLADILEDLIKSAEEAAAAAEAEAENPASDLDNELDRLLQENLEGEKAPDEGQRDPNEN